MYADDNSDLLVNFNTYTLDFTDPANQLTSAPEGVPWRTDMQHGQLIIPGLVIPPSTEADWKLATEMGYTKPQPSVDGPLFKFAPSPDIVHCPGDLRYQLPVGKGYSWDSYSGTTYLNGEAINGSATEKAKVMTKRTQLMHPSNGILWVEGADMRGENVGSWGMNADSAADNFANATFGDSPAAFHVTSATFSFADGHAESHKWLDGTTIAYATDTTAGKDAAGTSKSNAQHAGNVDALWVASHYPGGQNP
jgi:prepilin-type processing-associated H-X9-DG protein